MKSIEQYYISKMIFLPASFSRIGAKLTDCEGSLSFCIELQPCGFKSVKCYTFNYLFRKQFHNVPPSNY